jgi:hypothetical protein
MTSVRLAANFMIHIQVISIFAGYLFYPCSALAEAPTRYSEILNTLSGSSQPSGELDVLVEAINDVKQFRYSESFKALYDRYLVELDRLANGGLPDILYRLLDGIEDLATIYNTKDIYELLEVTRRTRRQRADDSMIGLIDRFESVLGSVSDRKKRLPSVDLKAEMSDTSLQGHAANSSGNMAVTVDADRHFLAQGNLLGEGLMEEDRYIYLLDQRFKEQLAGDNYGHIDSFDTSGGLDTSLQGHAPDSPTDAKVETLEPPAHKLALDRLTFLENALNKRIKGQPEAVQLLVNAESELLIYGPRKKPKVLVLMGPDGTGKETIARVYTDALHGYKDAHEKHMFRIPILKRPADLWQVMGAVVGHVGAEKFPRFLTFLAEHSGGRYQVKKRVFLSGATEQYLEEDPNWDPRTVPERGVVFIDGFQNWSSEMKDAFLGGVLETGIFQLSNPTPELSSISVPITFVISTTEGTRLITSRELSGTRDGRPLSFDQMMEKWKTVGNNPARLRRELAASNGVANMYQHEGARGISQSLLNTLPDDSFVLLRPLGPKDLQEIVRQKLQELSEDLGAGGVFGKFSLHWSDRLVQLLQEYHYVAENNAAPTGSRVNELVQRTLTDGFRSGVIGASDRPRSIHLDVEENPDRTFDLLFKIAADENETERVSAVSENKPVQEFRLRIAATESERPKEPISDERILELLAVPARLGTAILDSEESRTGGSPQTPRRLRPLFLCLWVRLVTARRRREKKSQKYWKSSQKLSIVLRFSQ